MLRFFYSFETVKIGIIVPMATETYQSQLETVQSLISTYETALASAVGANGVPQAVTVNGEQTSYQDAAKLLNTLYEREQRLRSRAMSASRGGIRVRGVTVIR